MIPDAGHLLKRKRQNSLSHPAGKNRISRIMKGFQALFKAMSMSHAINHPLQSIIENLWENRNDLSPTSSPKEAKEAIDQVIHELDRGALRVAEKINGEWVTHQWVKKAVLLSFRLNDNQVMRAGDLGFFDKVGTKFAHLSPEQMAATGVRVVPPAVARRGSFIAKGAILMPSYVNIGAYVDEGTMVDTWATVGSCAQIGKNVHPHSD